jgi:hypothetical protein
MSPWAPTQEHSDVGASPAPQSIVATTRPTQADEAQNPSAVATEQTAEPVDSVSLQAYLITAGAFSIWFNSWGAINAFGVFQTHYQLDLLSAYSAFEISWIGSVQNFLVLFVGFLSGPLYDAGYMRHLLGVGASLAVLGMAALSFVREGESEYWHAFISQGICVGLGWGLMFTPAASLPSRYWRKKLPVVMGLASGGTGIGGKWRGVTECAFADGAQESSTRLLSDDLCIIRQSGFRGQQGRYVYSLS